MTEQKIIPKEITKPIQLLAGLIVGLTLVNSSFLIAASQLSSPSWLSSALVLASIINVPLFLLCILLLQTRFRPELLEDSLYSEYLARSHPSKPSALNVEKEISEVAKEIMKEVGNKARIDEEQLIEILRNSEISKLAGQFAESRGLSELYMYPDKWSDFVDKWGSKGGFEEDMQSLIQTGLVYRSNDEWKSATLTDLGKKVCDRLQSQGMLFSQRKGRW